jgi:hypothetical protein
MIFPANARRVPGGTESATSWWTVQSEPIVLAFLERLRSLRLADWAEAASGDSAPDRRSLRQVIDGSPELANRAKGRIDDLLAAAEGLIPEPTLKAMRKAALTAVLAIVARGSLSSADFDALYAPFAPLIPLDTLHPESGWRPINAAGLRLRPARFGGSRA